jgi:hypothetical protein
MNLIYIKWATLVMLLLFYGGASQAQNSIPDCNEILNSQLLKTNTKASFDSLKTNLMALTKCGKLDSIDVEILSGPVMATIMVWCMSEEKVNNYSKGNYQVLIDCFNEFKKTSQFAELKVTLTFFKTYEVKIATAADFENDKWFFVALGMADSELVDFKDFISKHEEFKYTYKQAYVLYYNAHPKKPKSAEEVPIQFQELRSWDSVLIATKRYKRNALIYFTGHGVVNGRIMEREVLTDHKVKLLIQKNYIYYSAYVDDRTPMGQAKETVGQKNFKIQQKYCKRESQPHFCIIDSQGKVIAEIFYTKDIAEFIKFLRKGLK